jgi:hypothetical protein
VPTHTDDSDRESGPNDTAAASRPSRDSRADADADTDTGTRTDTDTDPSAVPDTVEWGDDRDRGVVKLELTRGEIEWIALEADEHDMEFKDWIRCELRVSLREDLGNRHILKDNIIIDVPDDLLKRARCWQLDAENEGHPTTAIEDVLDTLVDLDRVYRADGDVLEEGGR